MDLLYSQICSFDNLFRAWLIVKNKGSSGGVDGVNINKFEDNLEENLKCLTKELLFHKYLPQPYKEIKIPKDEDEYRYLGLPTIRDKIVQQAVKDVIEPILDKEFLNVSYGYRKNKGPIKAINMVFHLYNNEKRKWLTKCDIDNFFDNVDHSLLFKMLNEKIKDASINELLRVWIKMGKVDSSLKWKDSTRGIPQGAIISPLLSNLYLHPLDYSLVKKCYGYVRYADDFIVLSKKEGEAYTALEDIKHVLENRLKLQLNPKVEIKNVELEEFEYLGITFKGNERIISSDKIEEIKDKISKELENDLTESLQKIEEILNGLENYYGKIVPNNYLEPIDEWIILCLKDKVKSDSNSGKRLNKDQIEEKLNKVNFISDKYRILKNKVVKDIISYSIRLKKDFKAVDLVYKPIIDPIKKRKKEYQKLESKGFELVVTSPGSFIGITKRGILHKNKGIKVQEISYHKLKHILILSNGVSISSNLVAYCSENKIPIDYLDFNGRVYARMYPLQAINPQLQLSQLKAIESSAGRYLAKSFVMGKVRNQFNLTKYFYKYHKNRDPDFSKIYEEKQKNIESLIDELKKIDDTNLELFRGKLFSLEGRVSQYYWDIIQLILSGFIVFDGRERRGATDLVNSILNYGYGILYSKVWEAVIRSGLSPYISYLHKPQNGKPTLIYDLIEEFRAQGVDRIVISLITKGADLSMVKTSLSPETKKKLVKEVLEKINSYEKFRGSELRFYEIIRGQALAVAKFLSGERKKYLPYSAKW